MTPATTPTPTSTAPTTSTVIRLDTARTAQRTGMRERLDAGERIVGLKIALSSPATQARVGAAGPIWGWLTDAMQIVDGGVIDTAEQFRTKAEAELVFVLGSDLVGPGVQVSDVLAATAAICPGIELPGGRNPGPPADVADLIADNAQAGRFVLGPPVSDWRALDLGLVGALLEVDGQVVATGCGAAVLGHPARAVAQLANDLAAFGGELRSGSLIFSCGLTDPVVARPGTAIEATFGGIGRVGVRVV